MHLDANTSEVGPTGAEAVSIRLATVGDAAAVEAVHWASRAAAYSQIAGWPPAKPDSRERVEIWTQWLVDPEVTSVVAVVDGAIVGICTVRPSTDADADPALVATMPTLYVHPDAWHRGCGRALCSEATRRARERGFTLLTLWSLEKNTRAHDFYTTFGFEAEPVTMVVEWPHETLTARRYRLALT